MYNMYVFLVLSIFAGWPLCTDFPPKKLQKCTDFFVCTEMYAFRVKSPKIVILVI